MKHWPKVFLLLLILFAIGCEPEENQHKKETTYPVAGLFSLTGNWSSLGITSQEILSIAVSDVNTYLQSRESEIRLSATVYDTKLDTTLAKNHFQTVLNSLKARFIIGPQSSAEVRALSELANTNQIMILSQGSTASSLALPDDAVFRFCPGDGPEGQAISRTAYQAGKRMLITLARNDAGNLGLQSSVLTNFTDLGGQTDALTPYSTTQTDFTTILQQLRTKIQQHVATFGASGVGVYLASFDECTQLFHQAYNDPILSSIQWYGGDGVVQSAALLADADARRFAVSVSFFAPNFGLPTQAHPRLESLASAVRTKTGIDPDAYAISVYDAVWILATTLADFPEEAENFTLLKTRFNEQANRYFGISGPVMLNANGDRSTGAFDYWGIVEENGNFNWKIVGHAN